MNILKLFSVEGKPRWLESAVFNNIYIVDGDVIDSNLIPDFSHDRIHMVRVRI